MARPCSLIVERSLGSIEGIDIEGESKRGGASKEVEKGKFKRS